MNTFYPHPELLLLIYVPLLFPVTLLFFIPAFFARVSLPAYFPFLSPTQLSFFISLQLRLCPPRAAGSGGGSERGERQSAVSAGRLQERGGALETGAGESAAPAQRGGRHPPAAAQLPAAGSAGHAEGTHTQ